MTTNALWINKYQPVKSDEIIGNMPAINMIRSWLNNLNTLNTSKMNILIMGSHGIGKTTSANILLREFGYIPNNLDLNNITNDKDLNEHIDSLTKCNSISNMMTKNIKQKNALIIDEIETITSTIEKKMLEKLRSMNDDKRYLPIIFISNTQHTKFLSKFKKLCLVVPFNSPKKPDCMQLLNKIIASEKINITELIVKNQIIDYIQCDLRRLINVIQDLYLSMIDEPYAKITLKIFEDYISYSNKKEVNIGLFESTDQLFNNFNSISESILLYETEKIKLPLMIHEHYYNHVINKYKKKSDKLAIIKELSEKLSFGDIVEYHIYNEQDWDMQEFHGFLTCAAPSYLLNSRDKNNKHESFHFPQDLNKISIKKMNKKNIINIEDKFKNANIFDYIQMNLIIKKLLEEKRIKDIGDIFKKYKIDITYIESLLKIDKIIQTKNIGLSTKHKKELVDILCV